MTKIAAQLEQFLSLKTKGGLISKGILIFVPCNNFPSITVVNLFKFSVQESDLAPFIDNGTKVKIPS